MRHTITIDINLTPVELARLFWNLDDEAQAQFFIEIGRLTEEDRGSAIMQLHAVGRHLRDCPCSTYEGRSVVTEIAAGLGEEP